jgi:hypothetical protein
VSSKIPLQCFSLHVLILLYMFLNSNLHTSYQSFWYSLHTSVFIQHMFQFVLMFQHLNVPCLSSHLSLQPSTMPHLHHFLYPLFPVCTYPEYRFLQLARHLFTSLQMSTMLDVHTLLFMSQVSKLHISVQVSHLSIQNFNGLLRPTCTSCTLLSNVLCF